MWYASNAPRIAVAPHAWRRYYARAYRSRTKQLDALLSIDGLPSYVDRARLRVLAGQSEGAKVAASYRPPASAGVPPWSARLVAGWSCEFNFFGGCPHKDLHADPQRPEPVLNLMGELCEDFSPLTQSTASIFAAKGVYGT